MAQIHLEMPRPATTRTELFAQIRGTRNEPKVIQHAVNLADDIVRRDGRVAFDRSRSRNENPRTPVILHPRRPRKTWRTRPMLSRIFVGRQLLGVFDMLWRPGRGCKNHRHLVVRTAHPGCRGHMVFTGFAQRVFKRQRTPRAKRPIILHALGRERVDLRNVIPNTHQMPPLANGKQPRVKPPRLPGEITIHRLDHRPDQKTLLLKKLNPFTPPDRFGPDKNRLLRDPAKHGHGQRKRAVSLTRLSQSYLKSGDGCGGLHRRLQTAPASGAEIPFSFKKQLVGTRRRRLAGNNTGAVSPLQVKYGPAASMRDKHPQRARQEGVP